MRIKQDFINNEKKSIQPILMTFNNQKNQVKLLTLRNFTFKTKNNKEQGILKKIIDFAITKIGKT